VVIEVLYLAVWIPPYSVVVPGVELHSWLHVAPLVFFPCCPCEGMGIMHLIFLLVQGTRPGFGSCHMPFRHTFSYYSAGDVAQQCNYMICDSSLSAHLAMSRNNAII